MKKLSKADFWIGGKTGSMIVKIEVINRDKPILVEDVDYIATNIHTMQLFDRQGHLLRGIPKANILSFTVRERH